VENQKQCKPHRRDRYDHYNDFGDTANPRLGIVWSFLDNADLKLLYGEAFRAPNFVELYNDNNPIVMGNPDLQPEKTKTYEASLGYRFSEHLMMDMTYFYNDIEDLIVRDSSVSPAIYANLGGAKIDGIEIILTGKYARDNYWKLSYTYQDPRNSMTNERLPYVPLCRASGSVNYGLSKYPNIHTDVLWTGKRSRPADDTRTDVASYATVDLALIGKNFWKDVEISAAIHNLFDKKYTDPDTSGSSQYVPDDFPREGISAMLSISYKFF
jgi:iron complex outermembrane receptor protein